MSRIQWQDLEPEAAPGQIAWDAFRLPRGLEGPAGSQPVSVFIEIGALERAREHARSSPDAEIGGILYGRAYQLEEAGSAAPRVLVDIVAALPALGADGSPARLSFTEESWASIFESSRQLPGDLEVAGWYHSHPGWGIFLSGTDRRTQSAFFRKAWQVALVLDPFDSLEGAFVGPEGDKIALRPYRVPARPRSGLAAPATARASARKAALKWLAGAAIALAVLGLVGAQVARRRRG